MWPDIVKFRQRSSAISNSYIFVQCEQVYYYLWIIFAKQEKKKKKYTYIGTYTYILCFFLSFVSE